MQNKEAYNYKKVFSHPITLYRIGDIHVPFGFSLARLTIATLIFLVMLIFRDLVNAIAFISGLQLVLYLGVPFFLSGFLMKQRYNGKKIHHFLYDFSTYLFTIYLPKRKYANDDEVLYANDSKITFEKTLINKKGGADIHAIKNTDKKRTRQSYANKVG